MTTERTAATSAGVQSFARGLAVIRAFDAEHPEMTLSEVARETGLTRATARRFLLTLCELGYVRTDGKAFALTARALDLGYSYLSGLRLPDLVLPHLERLVAEVEETASLSVLDGVDAVFVARVPARRLINLSVTVGTRLPAHASATGRVLLAGLPREEVDRRFAGVTFDRGSIDSLPALHAELDLVRTRGWALTEEQLQAGVRSMAIPVADARGRTVAALSIAGHAGGEDAEAFREQAHEALTGAAQRIESEIIRTRALSRLMMGL